MAFPKPFYRWRPHPWHGLEPGPDPPDVVTAFIEITPYDLVKYEVDKPTGYIKVDRPQIGAAAPPSLYGFIPRTYCAERVAALSPETDQADGDPLDICIISDTPINTAGILVTARVVGGLRMIDGGEADDKIVAVLQGDPVWGDVEDLSGLPHSFVDRLDHYFSTYKLTREQPNATEIEERYGRDHAHAVVIAAMADYDEAFGD